MMEKVSNQPALLLLLVFCFSTIVESKDLRIVYPGRPPVRCERFCFPNAPIWPPIIRPTPSLGTEPTHEPRTESTSPSPSTPPIVISSTPSTTETPLVTSNGTGSTPNISRESRRHNSDNAKVKYLDRNEFHSALKKYQRYHKETVDERVLPAIPFDENCIIICCYYCFNSFLSLQNDAVEETVTEPRPKLESEGKSKQTLTNKEKKRN